jgi:hypothetical protein
MLHWNIKYLSKPPHYYGDVTAQITLIKVGIRGGTRPGARTHWVWRLAWRQNVCARQALSLSRC